jgi:multicomponent K+:H+ antiporter subunit E
MIWPRPVLSSLIAVTWLLLQQSLTLPQWLVAGLLAWWVPRALNGLLGKTPPLRLRPGVWKLTGRVLVDIVVANVTVARLALSMSTAPRPAWITLPLELRHPNGIAVLATIITTTPGTVSCVIDEDAGTLLIHALDCTDPQAVIDDIKCRYEKPLMEIFG